VHGHGELDNDYHLIVQTPEANLSQAIQWLNVSYVAWFNRRGDWGRPFFLWAARKYTGLTLREIGAAAGSMDYTAVAMAVKRFKRKANSDRALKSLMKQVEIECEM